MDNNGYDVLVSNSQDLTTTIDVTDNWWGVTDSAAIADMVYDRLDYGVGPTVDFVPFALEPFDIDDSLPVAVDDPSDPDLPSSYSLSQNFPNPFNGETIISFSLPRAAMVDLAIYNVLGRTVRHLASGRYPAGEHRIRFDGLADSGAPLASGVYFYRLKTPALTESKKMVIVK